MINQKFTFKKYNSITNSYREKTIQHIEMAGLAIPNVMWSLSEKIHGANLGAYSDGIDTQFASRNSFVSDSFYGLFNGLSEELTPTINLIAQTIIENYRDKFDIKFIIIYGELFGGQYPHKDIERLKGVSQVQDRVYYNPDVKFSAFDIYCECGEDSFYLNVDEANNLFRYYSLFHANELASGSLAEMLEYSNHFESTLPSLYGLPALPDNTCEGVVIKPIIAKNFNSGERVILKSKNIKFTERANRQPHTPAEPLTSEQIEAIEVATSYITENRLDAVLSKSGDSLIDKSIGKYMGLLVKDAIEELNGTSNVLSKLDKTLTKPINKHINGVARRIVLQKLGHPV